MFLSAQVIQAGLVQRVREGMGQVEGKRGSKGCRAASSTHPSWHLQAVPLV